MYKEYLAEFWYSTKTLENSKVSFSVPTDGIYGEVCVNTLRNAIGAHYLPHSREYIAPPCINILSHGLKQSSMEKPFLSKGLSKRVSFLLGGASFIIHSESASRNDASAASIAKANLEKSAPSTDLHVLAYKTQSIIEGLEILLTQPTTGKRASSIARQILSAHDFSSSLPTELKDLPFKFNELTEEVKGLKKQVHESKIDLPGNLKEIPAKLKDFTKTITSLTSQVTKLKTLPWELPAEFLSLPVQDASDTFDTQGATLAIPSFVID
uniref:Uncharacterized protein n=1 Tax=Tanacetum cinerariifolium TaxID=118510 RepID=A0A6L2MDM4_TANCI|nr:hypothetical protein [Tanacetum cinerariifolium]